MRKLKNKNTPNEYLKYGPFEMVRYGNHIKYKNNMNEQELIAYHKELAQNLPKSYEKINRLITDIAEIVKAYKPDALLHRAWGELVAFTMKIRSESEMSMEHSIMLRRVDYVQSVIASVPPNNPQEDVTDEAWDKLSKLIEELFTCINTEYQICKSAKNGLDNPELDWAHEEFHYKAQVYWCNVRGKRYLIHQAQHFADLLVPHAKIFKRLFDISVEDFLIGIQKLEDSLTKGLGEALETIININDAILSEINSEDICTTEDEIRSNVNRKMEERGLTKIYHKAMEDFLGLNLFDVSKVTGFPEKFLKEMSWEPGENKEFFAEGAFQGWPLKLWPIFQRPFIKLDNKYYCFDLYTFYDHLYRIIKSIILKLHPDYAETWNKRQKQVSEDIPLRLLEKILPGAEVYKDVYYMAEIKLGQKEERCETDGLLIYDDHLFILEVKAGAFSPYPPMTDFRSYIESIHELLFKPVEQGVRFLKTLEQKGQLNLLDRKGRKIARLSKSQFRKIIICAITLDEFTEIAAQAQHLGKLGLELASRPIWSISINDLRVYAEIFESPLSFLNYVHQRMRAFASDKIKQDDELDHLGLYLEHNNYVMHVEKFPPEGRVNFVGYRQEIDFFFAEKILDPTLKCDLKQDTPPRLQEIINFLDITKKFGRSEVVSELLSCNGEWRKILNDGIENRLNELNEKQEAGPLSSVGTVNITIFCWRKDLGGNRDGTSDHVQAIMLTHNESKRLLLELTFNEQEKLIDVEFSYPSINTLSESELARLKTIGEKIKTRRLAKSIRMSGKIGVNNSCPCGSGKKFKKCCRN
jgi:hypothetical protein